MKKFLLVLSLIISSCYTKPYHTGVNPGITEPVTKDCSNLMTKMKVLYQHGSPYEGQDFARVVAVDKLDGTMAIKILPPQTNGSFPLKEELNTKYTLRFVACYENPGSIVNGAIFEGACSYSGAINVLGGLTDGISYETHLKPEGFTAPKLNCEGSSDCWTLVHNTRDLYYNAGMLLPFSIMFVASDPNIIGSDFIVAIGDSPYKACYYGTVE